MIGSGWRIYNDDVLFGWLRFPLVGRGAGHPKMSPWQRLTQVGPFVGSHLPHRR